MSFCGRVVLPWVLLHFHSFVGVIEAAPNAPSRRISGKSVRFPRFLSHRRGGGIHASKEDSQMPPEEGGEVSYSLLGLSRAKYPAGWKENPESRVEYRDSPVDRHLIGIFTRQMAETSGTATVEAKGSYDELMRICFDSIRSKSSAEQSMQSLNVMTSMVPPGGDEAFRKLFPNNKVYSYETNAKITQQVFSWLVGPISVERSEENDLGVPMNSLVKIHKCRWLQESGCVGMCCSMCKKPTQAFFGDVFGLPLTIRPNYKDMSCEFHFGLTPPAIAHEDPAYEQPCFSSCKTANQDASKPCHKLPTTVKL